MQCQCDGLSQALPCFVERTEKLYNWSRIVLQKQSRSDVDRVGRIVVAGRLSSSTYMCSTEHSAFSHRQWQNHKL
eukprot:6208796-Pleurochrysis_carterae.AAC.2